MNLRDNHVTKITDKELFDTDRAGITHDMWEEEDPAGETPVIIEKWTLAVIVVASVAAGVIGAPLFWGVVHGF